MATLDLAKFREDTSNMITDWGETVEFMRSTHALIAGGGGAFTNTEYTSLTTEADVQTVLPKSVPLITIGGQTFRPEVRVFLRFGSDVQVGDRFSFSSREYDIWHVQDDEDKLVGYGLSRRDQS